MDLFPKWRRLIKLAVWLFDGIDRIFARSFQGWNSARNKASEEGNTEGDGRNFWGEVNFEFSEEGGDEKSSITDDKTEHGTREIE